MFKANFIQPARTEWVSSVAFEQKHNVSLSLFIELRFLNAFTVQASYPILRNEELIDPLGEEKSKTRSTATPNTEKSLFPKRKAKMLLSLVNKICYSLI